MEKGDGPPPYTTAIAETSASPYPGPPLDSSAAIQPAAQQYQQPVQPVTQPVAQQYQQPVQQYPQPATQQYQQPVQPMTQPIAQQYQQPVQQYPQPVAQQYQQPVQQYPKPVAQQYQQPVQQYPQPVAQQYQQPAVQQYPQPVAQQYQQPAVQQYPQTVAQQYQQPAPQPNIQLGQQQVVQQNQSTQPANHVVVQPRLTEAPGNMTCPFCKTKVMTITKYKLGMLTWLIAGSLFLFGIWPCCLIPFFVSACKDVEHSCPQCNNVLHVYRRM